MSALDALLGPRPPFSPCGASARCLRIDEDVLIHLHETHRHERVAICSVPGCLPPARWLSGRSQPWSHAMRLPADHRAWVLLQVEPGSHRLLIAEIWPRAALDASTFGQRLDAHVEHHRRWRERLQRPATEPSPA